MSNTTDTASVLTFRTGCAANGVTEVTYPSARAMVLAMTDKQARHFAVDLDSLRKARKAQRAFARKIDRLAKLLAREFPGSRLADGVIPEAHKLHRVHTTPFSAQLWIVRDSKILRAFSVHGSGENILIYVEQTTFPSKGADWISGQTKLHSTPSTMHTVAPAARRIVATPYHRIADAE